MHYRIMSDRNIITNGCAAALKSAVDTGAVLDIYLITDEDKVYISTNDRIKPDAAIITHDHITNDCSIRGNECIVAKLGVFIFNRKYYGHEKVYVLKFSVLGVSFGTTINFRGTFQLSVRQGATHPGHLNLLLQ
jgi:NDP-sugar pyrophosphorylase family protein